jgi:hypothetical protein
MPEPAKEIVPTGSEAPAEQVTPTETVNWEAKYKEVENQLKEIGPAKEFYEKASEVLGRDDELYAHWKAAAGGTKWEPKAAVPDPVKVEKPKGDLPPEIQKKLEEHDSFIQQAQNDREFNRHLRNVETELKSIETKWTWVDEAVQEEFAKRVEEQVKKEVLERLTSDPTQRKEEVVNDVREKWSGNLIASFTYLMDDKIQEKFRESASAPKLPFQLSTPADKLGKPSVQPGIHDRFKKALEAAETPDERAAIKLAYAKETGKDVNTLFSGPQMP